MFDYADAVPGEITPVGLIGSLSTGEPTYQWSVLSNAVEYQLLIYDRVLGVGVHAVRYQGDDICDAEMCQIAPIGVSVSEGNNRYWRVRALNSGGWGCWTPNQVFNVTGGQ